MPWSDQCVNTGRYSIHFEIVVRRGNFKQIYIYLRFYLLLRLSESWRNWCTFHFLDFPSHKWKQILCVTIIAVITAYISKEKKNFSLGLLAQDRLAIPRYKTTTQKRPVNLRTERSRRFGTNTIINLNMCHNGLLILTQVLS